MKKFLSIISLAALLSPAVAFADEPNEASEASHAAAFQQIHAKMSQLHTQARAQVLASLSPAHKAAFANIVGQLAISANPDPAAAARQLDALLSPGEKQAIVRAHDAARAQARSLMQAAHQQMLSSMPSSEHMGMVSKEKENEARETPDPGRILLMMAAPPMHEGMMHHAM
jgi:hypothetical protein